MSKKKRKNPSPAEVSRQIHCRICGQSFDSAVALMEHNLQDHQETEPEIWPREPEKKVPAERYLGGALEEHSGKLAKTTRGR